MTPQGFAQREINRQISCVTGRDRDLNLVRHEFLHYKFRIKYVSLFEQSIFFFPLWWAANIFTAAPTSDLEKGQKLTQTLLFLLETLIPRMKDASVPKSYLETRRRSYTTDWVCAAKSQIENRDMLETLVFEDNSAKMLRNAANSSKLREGRGGERGDEDGGERRLGRCREQR